MTNFRGSNADNRSLISISPDQFHQANRPLIERFAWKQPKNVSRAFANSKTNSNKPANVWKEQKTFLKLNGRSSKSAVRSFRSREMSITWEITYLFFSIWYQVDTRSISSVTHWNRAGSRWTLTILNGLFSAWHGLNERSPLTNSISEVLTIRHKQTTVPKREQRFLRLSLVITSDYITCIASRTCTNRWSNLKSNPKKEGNR